MVQKQEVSLTEIIELFIALDIIPQEKAEQARAVLKEKGYAAANASCPSSVFKYNLYLGRTDEATAGEVTRLQTWLATMPEIYPERLVTGYFGPATEQAVQRYQATQGIVSSGAPESTGYGVIGPKTRQKINACVSGVVASKQKDEKEYENDSKKDEYEDALKKEEKKEKKDEQKQEEEYTSEVTEISLHADQDNEKVWWEVEGYSKKGFKVVWSKDSEPTYPTRSDDTYRYYSDPVTDHAKLNAFDGSGRYYVRVCEYLGGTCGLYSNEVTIEL